MQSDLQKYIDKIRAKDDKIETRKGFSNSATTRKLQSAFRSIKCLQNKLADNVTGIKVQGTDLRMPSKAITDRIHSTKLGSRNSSRADEPEV